jgi:RNase P protein component
VQSARVRVRAGRLRTPEQFAAVAGARATWQAARQWLAVSARIEPRVPELGVGAPGHQSGDAVQHTTLPFESNGGGLRVGFTIARRHARRAVQRVMVKRLLREAVRSAAAELQRAAPDRRVDLVMRLRSPLPDRSRASLSDLKRGLRSEADSLLAQLRRQLRAET